MNARLISVLVILTLPTLPACQTNPEKDSQTRPMGETSLDANALHEAHAGRVDFSRHVKPILESKCSMCHNSEALPGKPSLTSREEATQTGALGLWIVPGQPDRSLLLTKIHDTPAHLKAMPPVGQQITREEIAVLRKWIKEGAVWPEGRVGRLKK